MQILQANLQHYVIDCETGTYAFNVFSKFVCKTEFGTGVLAGNSQVRSSTDAGSAIRICAADAAGAGQTLTRHRAVPMRQRSADAHA